MKTNKSMYLDDFRHSGSVVQRLSVTILTVLLTLMGMVTFSIEYTFAESVPTIQADSAVVMSGSTNEIVASVHGNRKMAIGSSVKLMTALVVIDRMHDDSEYENFIQITAKVDEKGDLFTKGESISVEDLLYAMLMEDSDEAAVALAIYSAGSTTEFVKEMNSRATEWKMTDTHFGSVTGIYKDNQYTSAENLALLVNRALSYPVVNEILSSSTHTTTPNKTTKARTFTRDDSFEYDGLECVLTATKSRTKSKADYIAVARQDGMQLIVVLLNDNSGRIQTDAKNLLDYGYKNVTKQTIVKAGASQGRVRVRHGNKTRVPVYTEYKGYVYVPEEGSDSLIRTEVVLDGSLTAPLKAGTKAGELHIYVADEQTGTVDLIIKEDVSVGWFPSWIYISNRASVIIGIVLLLVILLLLRIRSVQKKRRARAERLRRKRIQELARQQYEIEEDRRRRNWTYR